MTRYDFKDKMDSVYGAVREVYGYNDDADNLIDFLMTVADYASGEMVKG